MTIKTDLNHYLRMNNIAEGSIVVYRHDKRAVDLIESAVKVVVETTEGPREEWKNTPLKDWVSGQNGVVLARMVQGEWRVRDKSIEVLEKLLDKAVKK